MADENKTWTLDRHIPVAVIITLLGGIFSVAYYFGAITKDHESRIANLEKVIPEVQTLSRDITEIKTHLPYISKGIEDVQRRVEANTAATGSIADFLQKKIEWLDSHDKG